MSNKRAAKEITTPELCARLRDVMPPGSFRQRAAECGVLQSGRKELHHGRWTLFFPADAVEIMRAHLSSLPGSRTAGKAAGDGEQG